MRPDRTPTPPRPRSPRWPIAGVVILIVGAFAAAGVFALRGGPLDDARDAYARREWSGALRAAQAVLIDRPDDPEAALLAARSLTRLDQPDRAELYYRRAGALGPDDLQDRANGLIRLNRPDDAAPLLEALLARRPDDPLALQRLAAIRLAQGRGRDAFPLAERLVAVPGMEVRGRTLLGALHHQAKHYEQAVAAYLRVLELDPDLAAMPLPRRQFWSELALDLMAFGKTAEARGHLLRALESGRDAALLELVGLSHEQEGDLDRAEACWRRAVEWDPSLADAWLNLGRLELRRGRPADALPPLRRAAELSPEAIEPLYSMSQALRAVGQTEEAEELTRRVEQLRAADRPR